MAMDGNELIIQVAASATLIECRWARTPKRLVIATASGALGRADKIEKSSPAQMFRRTTANRCAKARIERMAAAAVAPSKIPSSAA